MGGGWSVVSCGSQGGLVRLRPQREIVRTPLNAGSAAGYDSTNNYITDVKHATFTKLQHLQSNTVALHTVRLQSNTVALPHEQSHHLGC